MAYSLKSGPIRRNKNARGFAYTDERRLRLTHKQRPLNLERGTHRDDCGKLNVYGTCDPLAKGLSHLIKKIRIQHPNEYGYFKDVYVLNNFGKNKVKSMRWAVKNKSILL